MANKRSRGVTFWGWIFIVFAVAGISQAINPGQQIKFYGMGIFIFGIIMSLAYLICGIFILRLNEAARKAAIILGLVSIISIPICIRPAMNIANYEEYYSKEKQRIAQIPPQYQKDAMLRLAITKETEKKALPVFAGVFGILWLSLELMPIYFFTRAPVKEQFKQTAALQPIHK